MKTARWLEVEESELRGQLGSFSPIHANKSKTAQKVRRLASVRHCAVVRPVPTITFVPQADKRSRCQRPPELDELDRISECKPPAPKNTSSPGNGVRTTGGECGGQGPTNGVAVKVDLNPTPCVA